MTVLANNRIVVACSADDRYAAPLTVMLKSMEMNLQPGAEVDVFVLDAGIQRDSKRKVMGSLNLDRLHLRWLRVPRIVRSLPASGHVSAAAYSRILIPDLVPPYVDKAIYLDSDIVVLGNIAELWARSMNGMPLLAVQDGNMLVSSPSGVQPYKELGLPADAKYLNSGVLVMDVAEWRRDNIHKHIIAYLRQYRNQVKYWDQDGINAVLATRWGQLEDKWNYRVCPPQAVPDRMAATVIDEIRHHAKIVHYASGVKPWDVGAVHPAKVFFYDVLSITEWKKWTYRPTAITLGHLEQCACKHILRTVSVFWMLWRAFWTYGKTHVGAHRERDGYS